MIPENEGKVFKGQIKLGEVRNPRGNPNMNIKAWKRTGPRSKEGKLKNALTMAKHGRSSKIISAFRNCDMCPLKEKSREVWTKDGPHNVIVPAKCINYKTGGKCVIPQIDFIRKLRFYYEIGEKLGTKELAKVISYRALENSEIAGETEIIEDRKPGMMAHKFLDLASKNTESINKIEYGEKTENTNLNVNMNVSDIIIEAYKNRKEEKEKDI